MMKTSTKRTTAVTVDEYLKTLPVQQRIVLEDLRQLIKSIVPEAEEVISYQVPTYKYHGALVHFAAFKDHCSFFPGRTIEDFKEELKPYEVKGTTIHFSPEKPLPASLIRKIVETRMKENEAKASLKNKRLSKTLSSCDDAKIVNEYMHHLQHPLKAEIEAVRLILKNANPNIAERIKWNAPSYYYKKDLVTFNLRASKHVHLVFHHPTIVNIPSSLLKGEYKDRRMLYFSSMQEVIAGKEELTHIINQLVSFVHQQ